MVPVQRERVLTAVPAETAEDGPVDGPLLHRGPRPAQGRPAQAKPRKPYRLSCERLWARVAEWPGCGWSPLLISGRLRVLFPDDSAMRVCPQTAYRWVYADRHRRERRARCLPRGHRRRRKRMGRKASRFPIPGRVSISRRPPEADDRSGFGHWEADGAVGVGCDLHTEVERKTRFLMARIVPGKTAGESVGARLAMFSPLPAGARGGVTHDNGTEFARHTPAEAFADELLNLQDKQGCCTSKIDNGLQVFWHYLGQYAGNLDMKSPGKQLAY